MARLERLALTANEFTDELAKTMAGRRDNKYAFQVGLKDLDFEVDEDQARALG